MFRTLKKNCKSQPKAKKLLKAYKKQFDTKSSGLQVTLKQPNGFGSGTFQKTKTNRKVPSFKGG